MTDLFLGLGELLWDCFPDRRMPGGAPANVAFHAQQLGLNAATVTRVGCDQLGDEICRFLQSQGLCLDLVQCDPIHGTGTVTVDAGPTGTNYVFKPDSAWDFLEPTSSLLAAMQSARAVCFGTLAQRNAVSRETIHACLNASSPDCLIVYDINLRPPFYERAWIERSLHQAQIVKLNDEEVRILAGMFDIGISDNPGVAKWLLTQFDLQLVCVTRGGAGCLLVSPDETIDVPGVPVHVVDTVGAGDSFTAALIQTRLAGWPLRRSAEFANRVGALVASRPGAMPVLQQELAELRAEFA
ncbi:MAG: carbohydrate kinase [Planctomycetes bacterium]|nr:carbohydrate kinase [Planctomycetota bacterium]